MGHTFVLVDEEKMKMKMKKKSSLELDANLWTKLLV